MIPGFAPEPTGPARFEIDFATDIFWAGEARPGFPLMRWPDDSLCVPATGYFGYLCQSGKGIPSTFRDRAYILRDWLVYLWRRSISYLHATDQHIGEWRQFQKTSKDDAEQTPSPTKRVAHKISVVVDFYRSLRIVFAWREEAIALLPIVADENTPLRHITYRTATDRKGQIIYLWGSHLPGRNTGGGRPTPSAQGAMRVAEHLRTGRARRSNYGETLSERDWLMQECMRRAGLRPIEVSTLTLSRIWAALANKKWSEKIPMKYVGRELEFLAENTALQEELLSDIEQMKRRGTESLPVRVMGKGGSSEAQFPLELVMDLLEIGIWFSRRFQIRTHKLRNQGYSPPDKVFLSFKTGKALQPNSVGDIVKDAFKEAKVDGSASRLRARAGVNFAIKMRLARRVRGGDVNDTSLGDYELELLREFLRHRQGSKVTFEHYIKLSAVEAAAIAASGERDRTNDKRAAVIAVLDGMSAEEIDRLGSWISVAGGRIIE